MESTWNGTPFSPKSNDTVKGEQHDVHENRGNLSTLSQSGKCSWAIIKSLPISP